MAPDCAGCHLLFDPIGFAFEDIDGIGRSRTSENGLPIDTSGDLIETDVDVTFSNSNELLDQIGKSREAMTCHIKFWLQFALQGPSVEAPPEYGESVNELLAQNEPDLNLRRLIVNLTATPLFMQP
jgi:hypothetical protein